MPTTTRTTPESTHPTVEDESLGHATAVFVALRPRLQNVAYRILGSWAEAEDTVQDAWVRWQTCDRTSVRNPTAFLVTMTTRLAINSAKSARARRESSVGDWLPEPADAGEDPTVGPERAEALEVGVFRLLQRLSPTERAAYVLRQAFDYPYPAIADTLQLTEANARQLVSRAGKHLAADRHQPVIAADHRRLVNAFVAAARRGEVTELEGLLAA